MKCLCLVLVAVMTVFTAKAQIALDPNFNTGAGFSNEVRSFAIQPDGKIIVGGTFLTFNGTSLWRLARLNADGTLDNTFYTNVPFEAGYSPNINAIVIQPDGKIIVGGSFSNPPHERIARLNADGTLDTVFAVPSGFNGIVEAIALQPDGKIIVGGQFSNYDGTNLNKIVRLNANGTIDNTFATGWGFTGGSGGNGVSSLAIQSDGKIIVGGWFTSYDGASVNKIARLNTDGTLDNFTAGTGFDGNVYTLAIQNDGKILVGGSFNYYNGANASNLIRLNADGTLDFNGNPGIGAVNALAIQADGKIVAGGNGYPSVVMRRLNTNGTIDNTFDMGTGFNHRVYALGIQTDGKIIVGGIFTAYNGITDVNRIARLNTAAAQYTVTTSANPVAGGLITGGGTYYDGVNVTMSATSNTGYNFVKWTEGGATVSTDNPFAFTIAANRVLEAVFETTTTSINEINESNIKVVFPNPASHVLNVEVKENANIKIVNVSGKIVVTQKLNPGHNSINVSELSNGVYFMSNDKGGVVKFIKE